MKQGLRSMSFYELMRFLLIRKIPVRVHLLSISDSEYKPVKTKSRGSKNSPACEGDNVSLYLS